MHWCNCVLVNWACSDNLRKILCRYSKKKGQRTEAVTYFLGKGVLKISSKFTGEHPCRSVISIKLQSNFIEIALRHGYFPVKLVHIFRNHWPKNTSGGLLLLLKWKFRKIPRKLPMVQYHKEWQCVFLLLRRSSGRFRKYSKQVIFRKTVFHFVSLVII